MVKRFDMAAEENGLNNGQVHRVLEDLQTIAMVGNIHTYAIEKKDEKLIRETNDLLRQVTDGLGRDITGMLNGKIIKK